METERIVVEVVRTAGFWYAQACVQVTGAPNGGWVRLAQTPSRDRARAISYALTEAALAFERGEI